MRAPFCDVAICACMGTLDSMSHDWQNDHNFLISPEALLCLLEMNDKLRSSFCRGAAMSVLIDVGFRFVATCSSIPLPGGLHPALPNRQA